MFRKKLYVPHSKTIRDACILCTFKIKIVRPSWHAVPKAWAYLFFLWKMWSKLRSHVRPRRHILSQYTKCSISIPGSMQVTDYFIFFTKRTWPFYLGCREIFLALFFEPTGSFWAAINQSMSLKFKDQLPLDPVTGGDVNSISRLDYWL